MSEALATIIREATFAAALRAQSPQVTTEEGRILAGKPSMDSFYRWASEHQIRCIKKNAWSREQIISALQRECRAAQKKAPNNRGAHNKKSA